MNQDPNFFHTMNDSIKYNYFNKLERYALLRARNWSNPEREEYFSYREKIDLNDSDLSLFEPYITYLMNYFNEKTLDSGKVYFYEKNNTDFNIKKLLIIDSKITNQLLKNNLARATAIEEILNFKNNDYADSRCKAGLGACFSAKPSREDRQLGTPAKG